MNARPELVTKQVNVAVIGCGGTGAHVVQELPRFHLAKYEQGHPGIKVTVFDPARVSRSNIVRQRYFGSEVGMHKCEVLIRNRINPAYATVGVHWLYKPRKWGSTPQKEYDIIVSCVDTKEARRAINKSLCEHQYIIDCGNGADFGQVLVGGPGIGSPYETVPELLEGDDDNLPSCSFAQSVSRQGLTTNMMVASYALAYLEDILRWGRIETKGCYINLQTKTTKPIKI